jgi:phosphatidylserine/phosphatidylglycerophosphate/cardiolipin synthase-like enzyme
VASLHAKLVVADRNVALVGSSNLTLHGMVRSHEISVIIRGPAADAIAGRVDALLRSSLVTPYR